MALSSEENAHRNSMITNRRRFIGGSAAAATGLWAAPKVMAAASHGTACSPVPLSLTVSTTTICSGVVSSEGNPLGRAKENETLDIEGCTSCAAGLVDVYLTAEYPEGGSTGPLLLQSEPSTGGCTVLEDFPSALFGGGVGTVYTGYAEFQDHPDVNASISWVIVDENCDDTPAFE